MSNQERKGPIQDRAKMRRSYVWNSTKTNALTMTLLLCSACLGLVNLVPIIGLVVSVGAILSGGENAVGGIVGVVVCGFFTAIMGWLTFQCFSSALAVPIPPYVPPVREQIATLPPDEVLLRGSDQPAATPDELLRATQVTQQTTAEELLRSMEGRSE